MDPSRDPFALLSAELEGDVLKPVWFKSPAEVEALFGPGSYPVYRSGRFRYHWLLGLRYGGFRQKLASIWFYIWTGLKIYRERRYDCMIAYSHLRPGLCGVVLKAVTRAKLIIEIVTSPDLIHSAENSRPTFRDRMNRRFAEVCLHICVWSCDRVWLRAPTLLKPYPKLRGTPASVFPGFVLVSQVPKHTESDQPYVVLVGAPWYLKGVDLLVAAFRRLAADFPQVSLKVLGYYTERAELDVLIGGSAQIEILKARANPETLEIISGASIFALPSRCEGTPRVILEAMAAGIPVVGSDVGGIPYLVRDGETGFVVPVGDGAALEARLRQLLSDAESRKRMGARGYELAHREFSEKAYVEQFRRMVVETVGAQNPS